jgi:hypothetical protein
VTASSSCHAEAHVLLSSGRSVGVWNGTIDRHPAVIAGCNSADDVAAAIQFAWVRVLQISGRGWWPQARRLRRYPWVLWQRLPGKMIRTGMRGGQCE